MENETVLKGEIVKIILPVNGVFSFEEGEVAYSKFILKPEEKNSKSYFCCGSTFPVKQGEFVKLTGQIFEKDGKSLMKFDSICRDYSTARSKKSFLEMVCGIATSKKIIQYFNNENTAFDIIKYQPERLLEIKGIKESKKERIVKKYKKNTEVQEMHEELSVFGFTLKDTLKIYKKMGKECVQKVKNNPYILIKQMRFSFEKCDAIALRANIGLDSLKRTSAGIYSVLSSEEAKGHTFTFKDDLLVKCRQKLTTPQFTPKASVILSCFNKMVESYRLICDDNDRVYVKTTWDEEEVIRNYVNFHNAKRIPFDLTRGVDLDNEISLYEQENNFSLGKEQKLAVKNSLSNRLSIITGGPGTGKTTVLSTVIKLAMKFGITEDDIALCAPTGKAARRMMESINGALGTAMTPTTIHTLLEVDPTDEELEQFVYNENNKLPYKLIVCDESSMIDLSVASAMISAIKRTTQVIFVGDIEQLPSVSYGNFLRDLIDSKVPCVKLLEIHRQKGGSSIITLSQQIRDEVGIDLTTKKDFAFLPFNGLSYQQQMDKIVNLFMRGVEKSNLDQTVVLTPINGKTGQSELGCKQISLAIQDKINPLKEGEKEVVINGWKFRKGSKVMITKNNNQLHLVNGQIGYISSIDFEDKTIDVSFEEIELHEGKPFVTHKIQTLDEENIENLVLGYAITIHKSQGSEWQNVIQVCAKENAFNNTKALVYTGITRAKKNIIIVGDKDTLISSPFRKGEERRSRILN